MKYFSPVNNIKDVVSKISNKKIGIHIRSLVHYQNYDKTEEQFLSGILFDIENLMKGRENDDIYLATQLESVINNLSKYNITIRDIPRTRSLVTDWCFLPNCNSTDAWTDCLIDVLCLSKCDEIWGGPSNMLVFASCLNPNVTIKILPSLQQYNGL